MFPFMPLRRIKILLSGRGAKRRDHTFHSLQDCLDKPTQKKNGWKVLLLAWVLAVVLYYLYWDQTTNVPSQPFLEVFPEAHLDVLKEKLTMNDVFNYEKDPHKIKKILKNADNSSVIAHFMKEVIASSRIPTYRKRLPWCSSRVLTRNVSINKNKKSKDLDNQLEQIVMGGYYNPRDCRSRHKVGILVPYRDREENLAVFLYNIHRFLMRQNLEYRIFVIEQFGKDLFNRGRLFNAGFLELEKMGDWPCVVFHDVDLLPTDNRIMYTCPSIPRHMCAVVLEKEHLPSYRTLFGGVTAMTAKQYKKANGYSNLYWGWGGEDNDMFWRLKESRLGVTRYSKEIARYTSLPHKSTSVNQFRFQMLKTATQRYKEDGVSSIRYTAMSYQIRQLYTHILVDINPLKENVTKFFMSLKMASS